jgi:ABC-type cobalamin/Fe3+-siderophores transport system ATPase subunit
MQLKNLNKMNITVIFPNNEEIVFEQGIPVVLLGANGSGKTRFGVKLEELNDKRMNEPDVGETELLIQRISAQKSLSIQDTITLLDYDSAHRNAYLGTAEFHFPKIASKYQLQPATHLVDDFNKTLTFLFAKNNKELEDAHQEDREASEKGVTRPPVITTIVERVTQIWNELLPKRRVDLSGSGVHAIMNGEKYHGKEMSDGERVILYMICQALLLPQGSVLIIDEPELHIHKSIVKKLWDRLESERSDCVFVYITHDLDFAASRNTDKVLWIKQFDGSEWEYEFLNIDDFSELPKELLFELVGTRKKVIFVEGDRNSLDFALYNEFFKDKGYHVIPCGGCSEVIRAYKAEKAYRALSSIDAYCLIDRDYRTEEEIKSLEDDGVKFLKVAEVENLFIVPALLDIMEQQLGCDVGTADAAKQFIIGLFNENKDNQVKAAFFREVNHQLTSLNVDGKQSTPETIHDFIVDKFSESEIKKYFESKKIVFDEATDIDSILCVFNCKELSGKIGAKFNLHGNKEYPKRVINYLRLDVNGCRGLMLHALSAYIPAFSEEEVEAVGENHFTPID